MPGIKDYPPPTMGVGTRTRVHGLLKSRGARARMYISLRSVDLVIRRGPIRFLQEAISLEIWVSTPVVAAGHRESP